MLKFANGLVDQKLLIVEVSPNQVIISRQAGRLGPWEDNISEFGVPYNSFEKNFLFDIGGWRTLGLDIGTSKGQGH